MAENHGSVIFLHRACYAWAGSGKRRLRARNLFSDAAAHFARQHRCREVKGGGGLLDAGEIECIVEACYDDVLAYCRRHAPRGIDPRDVAQETFLRFVRCAPRYAEAGKPRAYLVTIARNLCIDAARTSREVPAAFGERSAADAEGGGAPHEAEPRAADSVALGAASCRAAAGSEGDVELALALEKLPDDLREAVELRYDQGFKIGEIAKVLGISRFAVRRRIEGALARLKGELDEGAEAPDGRGRE